MDKASKIQRNLSLFFKFFVLVLIFLGIWEKDYFLILVSAFVLFLMFLPAIINRRMEITLPTEFDFFLSMGLFLHYALGEHNDFYLRFFWWDSLLHAANSIILGLVGFAFAYALLMTHRIKAKPFFISLFALTFSVSMGTLWEIFEFGMDQLFGFNMQKSGLMDTMKDLIIDFLGALLVSVIGFFYLKNPKNFTMMHDLINRLISIKKK